MRTVAMSVGALIDALKDCNEDDLVILARDAEGNGFAQIAMISEGMYINGGIKLRSLTSEDEADGYTEEDVATEEEGALPCVVLWPVG